MVLPGYIPGISDCSGGSMLYIIGIIAAIFIGSYLYDKFNEGSSSTGDSYPGFSSQSTPAPSYNNIPVALRNIHTASDSFWDTVDFYVRLGNACYSITHNAYAVSICVYNDGKFTVDFFDMESARTLIPELDPRDMNPHFEGQDKNGQSLFTSLYGIKNTLENDAPEATVQVFDSYNMKSACVKWKGFYET